MSVAVVTGSGGLVGSAAVRRLAGEGLEVVGIDNDMRAVFFGPEGSTGATVRRLEAECPGYRHLALDIRDGAAIRRLFAELGRDLVHVVHAAAQPAHDWAAREPETDFAVNAVGTLNLLAATLRSAPEAGFVFLSTNKVYGDAPNALPLLEAETRYVLDPAHPWAEAGIDETMGVDQVLHSLFGASKLAADVLVQEYGRYFGLKTTCLRAGCLTGADHAGVELHGFLAYLMKCTTIGRPYRVFGHGGKQVRDNLDVRDLAEAIWRALGGPARGAVYNIGGGTGANCSLLEAIELAQEIAGRRLEWTYLEEARVGDHRWWISDTGRFAADHGGWRPARSVRTILADIHAGGAAGWRAQG